MCGFCGHPVCVSVGTGVRHRSVVYGKRQTKWEPGFPFLGKKEPAPLTAPSFPAPPARPKHDATGCDRPAPLVDHEGMGWFTKTDEGRKVGTLTEQERAQLASLEAKVSEGVGAALAMIEAGKALATIRERQLFRDTAASWDDYISARFRITKRRADQMIAFSSVSDAVGPDVTISEKAARPLVGMPAETIRAVVAEAAASPQGVTTASIREAAAKRKPKPAKAKAFKPRRFKVPGAVVTIEWNRKATGSIIDALTAALRMAEDELSHQSEAA